MNFKNRILAILIAFLIAYLISFLTSCNPAPEIRYVTIVDSTCIKDVVYYQEVLRRTQDSLNAYKCDTTMDAELFIAKYKLERIRYYNKIAAKGNNIKYLRGWLNRVLNE